MNEQQTGIIVKWVGANWPSAAMTADTIEVFVLELAALDFDEALATLREDFADAPFPPTPMALRNAVLRRGLPQVADVGALIDELLNAVSGVGYASPEPEWSSPIIGEWVERRGGWVETCRSTPARASADAAGLSMFNTWRAQTRDDFRALAGREDHAFIRSALGGTTLELD